MRPQHLLALLMVTAAALGASSCTVDETSMLILGAQPPPTGEECIAEAETTVFITQGILDVKAANSYTLFLSLENQLQELAGDGGLEGNSIQLIGATVILEGNLGIPTETFIPLSSVLKPQTSAGLALEVIDRANLAQLRTSAANVPDGTTIPFLVRIQLEGESTSGTKVESPEFVFPAEMCVGCLTGGVDYSDVETPLCTVNDALPEIVDGCTPGQNQAVSCGECHLYVQNIAGTEGSEFRCGRLNVIQTETDL